MKLLKRFRIFLLAGLMALGTGCSYQEEDAGAGYLFSCELAGNPVCLDPQYTQNPFAPAILANTMEGLLRLDAQGNLTAAGAESYTVSEDGLQYMFNLRPDCYWYGADSKADNAIPVTASDYVFAFQRLVDPAMCSPYGANIICLKNAAAIMQGSMEVSALGISAPDQETVMFELEQPNPEFPEILAQSYTVPCNEEFFLSTKGRYGLDEKTVLCNGPFWLNKWNYDAYSEIDNFISLRKNSVYYDADTVFPSSLQFNIAHSRSAAEQEFADGVSDVFLTDAYPRDYLRSNRYAVEESRCMTMGLIFNPEHPQLSNKKLRLALASGIDRSAFSSLLSEDLEPAYGLIPPAVTMLGRSYRELYADEPLAIPYDPIQAGQLFEEASAELGLHAMNTMQIMVPSSILDTDALLAVCQQWQNIFGYYIGIETVSPDEYDRRLAEGEYAIALWSFTPERNSCYAALQSFESNSSLLDFHSNYFTTLMETLSSADRLADSIQLYGAAEQSAISANAFVPLFYKNAYLVHTVSNTDIWFEPFDNAVCFRDAKHFSG